jgi:hypothetical protein
MDCPKGTTRTNYECLELLKSSYGLVQSSRHYFKKFTGALKKMGFQGGQVDPCLMMKTSSKGLVFITIYVDDCLIVGARSSSNARRSSRGSQDHAIV